MALRVYADRMSQPSRAVLIFCKVNGIEFEEIRIDVLKNQQHSLEYKAINPMHQVPAIVHGQYKLFESHAILMYLSCSFPGVASHWYPGDIPKRAKIHSVLDWHHSNLRGGSGGFVFSTIVLPIIGFPPNPQAARQCEGTLMESLSTIENFWLKDGRFLVGCSQPSIADLSLVCELMQLKLLDEKDRDRILKPYKKVVQWIEDTKSAASPHFDEVHEYIFNMRREFEGRQQRNRGRTN